MHRIRRDQNAPVNIQWVGGNIPLACCLSWTDQHNNPSGSGAATEPQTAEKDARRFEVREREGKIICLGPRADQSSSPPEIDFVSETLKTTGAKYRIYLPGDVTFHGDQQCLPHPRGAAVLRTGGCGDSHAIARKLL